MWLPATAIQHQTPEALPCSTVILTRVSDTHEFMAKGKNSAYGQVYHGNKPVLSYHLYLVGLAIRTILVHELVESLAL